MRCGLPALLRLLLTALQLPAQVADRTAGKDEFPALQLLPPGSKVQGISLPRYQNHRVTAHIIAGLLEVCTRHLVQMSSIRTMLYGEDDEATEVKLEKADYDFSTGVMRSDAPASVTNPRFSASGASVIFNTTTQRGLLHGPVHTTLNRDLLTNPPTTPQKLNAPAPPTCCLLRCCPRPGERTRSCRLP